MSNSLKIVIIILGLFLYLSVKIVHDRTFLEYGKLRRTEMKLSKQGEECKYTRDSLQSYSRIVGIAKGELNMIFPRGSQKKVIE
ncbi:MAG: hypothetical protein GWP03_06310 [Proteobacteria bacterium]|nr:hypothetical protein [Pseudomonadota bacterium]